MLEFTDRAREMVLAFMDAGADSPDYLRVAVSGSDAAPTYELTLVAPDERRPDERVVDLGEFTALVAEAQAERLQGATVDYVERVNESGFEVRPREIAAPGAASAADEGTVPSSLGTDGPIAAKVREVLDEQVNPAIASHGGAISLVGVEDTEIYLEMSGGCQGCAMSRMTLRQGVERMLRQAVPELTAVHDITDHASGVNPFYDAPVV